MASPFRFFRKNQKAFLAIAAVLAMFIFIGGDFFMGYIQQSGGGPRRSPKAIVTSWDGGSVKVQELEMLVQRRYFISEFLNNLQMLGGQRILSEGGTPIKPQVPDFIMPPNSTPEAVRVGSVSTRILAEQARKTGMDISDEMVNHFLRETGLRRINDQDIVNIIRGMRRVDQRTGEQWLFSGLRELLLSNFYMNSITSSVMCVLPEDRWEDWQRINDRISLEAAIVKSADFVAEVAEPSEAQLAAFYDEHKDRVSGNPVFVMGTELPSPDPGFREPRRVQLHYLLGDVSTWTHDMLGEVSEEEIADYYERNKRTQFVKMSSQNETVSEQPDDTEEKPKDEEQSDQPEANESGDVRRQSSFRLTALQEDLDTEEAAAEESDNVESSDDAESDDEETASEQTSEQSSNEEEDDESVEYEPLEKVRDQIRRQLANDKAVVELQRLMESAFADLTTVYNRYGGDLVAAESEERKPPAVPARLTDFTEMAKNTKLAYEQTNLLSQRELADTLVGKAVDAQSGRQYVVGAAFRDLKLHEPYLAKDIDGYWYLVVKVEDKPSRIPPLDEIHEQVTAAWKLQEAAKLALTNAEDLALQAEESGKSLEAFFTDTDNEVVTTDMFSWLSFGSTQMEMRRGPRLGDAPPLEAVGNDFMIQAFSLEPEKVLALQNFDKTQAFILRLASRELTAEELRSSFLADAYRSQAMQIMTQVRLQNSQRQMLSAILDRVGLDREKLNDYLRDDSAK